MENVSLCNTVINIRMSAVDYNKVVRIKKTKQWSYNTHLKAISGVLCMLTWCYLFNPLSPKCSWELGPHVQRLAWISY